MLQACEEKLLLDGKGESEQEAFQEIFQQIKPTLAEKYKGILVHIEPVDIRIVDAIINVYTEKLFGLLFPRKRKLYLLKVEVTVKLCCLDTAAIVYRQEEEKLSTVRHILEMR